MGLTNPQYEKIQREYDKKQARNRAEQERRIRHAFSAVAGLKEIESSISDFSVQRARALLAGDREQADRLARQLANSREGKEVLLASAGLCADYMDMHYHCPKCRDTGYIKEVEGEKCTCFQQAIADLLFSRYPIHEQLARENFDTFSFDYFDCGPKCARDGKTPYENMQMIHGESRRFVDEFIPGRENLLLIGRAGTGKTFLSNCIAGALLNRGFSVLYLSAGSLFESLAQHAFSRAEEKGQTEEQYRYILDSDLLIIDDLGTELNNSFVTSQLFFCINERAIRRKSTIISTNLDLNQIRDTYSERVSSRILESYRDFRFYNSDIRIKKRHSKP